MARNMNAPASFLSDYNPGAMPIPPWKANTSGGNNNAFPIPPRDNDLGMHQKSSNFEWNKPNNQSMYPMDTNMSQGGSLGFSGGRSDGFGGTDYNRHGNQAQGFTSDQGLRGGSDLKCEGTNFFGGSSGNVFDNRNGNMDGGGSGSMFDGNRAEPRRDSFGSNPAGFNDNLGNNSFNNSGSDRNGNMGNMSIDNGRNGSFDRGSSNFDHGQNYNRGDNFDRGGNIDTGGNFDRGNFNQAGIKDIGMNLDRGPKSLLDNSVAPPWKPQNNDIHHNNSSNENRNNQQNRRQDNSPRRQERYSNNEQDSNKRTRQSSGKYDNLRNQSKPGVNQPKNTLKSPLNQTKNTLNSSKSNLDQTKNNQAKNNQAKTPLKNPLKAENIELEKRALASSVTEEFFAKIKPLSLIQVAADVALRYARKEFYLAKGNNQKIPDKAVGHGQYTCKTCFMNFLTKEKLNTHNNGAHHKELEDIFCIKKEQARLIMDKKILGPIGPKLEMISISRAEVENSLKPAEMELDVYILGIYESVMKAYWPLPKSKHYCRVCNYVQFNSESELKRHNLTVDHKKAEGSYEAAFCLYCQQHYYDKVSLERHVSTAQHAKIKDLMERTKECAVQHWHKVNNIETTEKLDVSKETGKDNKVTEPLTAGMKRSASDNDGNKSPVKKPSTSKSDKTDNKLNDRKSTVHAEKKVSAADNRKANTKPFPKWEKKEDSKATSKTDVKVTPKTDVKVTPKSDVKVTPKSDAKVTPKSDAKVTSKSDLKVTPKSDLKVVPKSDAKAATTSDTNQKADGKGVKSEPKSDAKSATKDAPKVDPKAKDLLKEKVWFAPINGFLCIACHDFIANEDEQKTHASGGKHKENVAKFKKSIID